MWGWDVNRVTCHELLPSGACLPFRKMGMAIAAPFAQMLVFVTTRNTQILGELSGEEGGTYHVSPDD